MPAEGASCRITSRLKSCRRSWGSSARSDPGLPPGRRPDLPGKIDKFLFQAQLQAIGAAPVKHELGQARLTSCRRLRASRAALPRPSPPAPCAPSPRRRSSSVRPSGRSPARPRPPPAPRSAARRASPQQRAEILAVLARQLLPGANSPTRLSTSCRARSSSALLDRRVVGGLVDLGLRVDVLGDIQRLEHSASPFGRIRQSFSLPASTNRPIRADCSSFSTFTAVRTAAGLPAPWPHQEVRAVEVDRVDLAERKRTARCRSSATCSAARSPPGRRRRRSRTGPSRPPQRGRSRPGHLPLVHRHQRRFLIGVLHSSCSCRNEMSDARADGFVAGASPTGIVTRLKLIDPFPGRAHGAN